MKKIFLSFKQSAKNSPYVFGEMNRYFGFYFAAFGLLALFLFERGFSGQEALAPGLMKTGLIFLAQAFTVFIIPYCAYKRERGKARPFWLFIGDSVWPVVLNHIKAFFVILLFLLLLIIPGIYKAIRLSFLTETVLFDSLYKQGGISALKSADKATRGSFWPLFLFVILQYIILGLPGLLKIPFLPSFAATGLSFLLSFYVSCFVILLKCQFYFELKKARGEEISC